MKDTNDKLWYLAAAIPACIAFGPLFISFDWGPWMLVVGLVLMFYYITALHKRITALEEKISAE